MAKSATTPLKTTGHLRRFLADTMLEIKNGQVENDVARNIIKMSAQLNESFYSEAKIAKLQMEAGETAAKFGELTID